MPIYLAINLTETAKRMIEMKREAATRLNRLRIGSGQRNDVNDIDGVQFELNAFFKSFKTKIKERKEKTNISCNPRNHANNEKNKQK